MEIRSSEEGVTSLAEGGVCGRVLGVPAVGLRGVPVVRGRESAMAEGGRLNEAALLGDLGVPDPSEEPREGPKVALIFDTDSGGAFHIYAADERDRGRIKPAGRGGC